MPFLILQHHDGTFYWHHQLAFLSAIILRLSIPAVVCPAGAGVVGHTPISVDISRPPGIDPVIVNHRRAVIYRCGIVNGRCVIIGWIICIGVSRRIIPVVVICSGIIVPAVIVSSWGQPIIFMMIAWSIMILLAVMMLWAVVLLSIVVLRIVMILLAVVLLWAIRCIVGRRPSFWISIINCRAICHQH